MRTTTATVETYRQALREQLDKLPLSAEQKKEVSASVAKFTAAVVRDDRVHRKPYDGLAKFADVFFNGRPA